MSTRHQRLTDEEIRQRMLAAAHAIVEETGLSVSLDHLVFEEIIQTAGVSRTAAFRIWINKQAFYDELLLDIAGPSWQGTAAFDQETINLALRVIEAESALLQDPRSRFKLLVRVCRLGAERNFVALSTSKQWRSYVVLCAMSMSMPVEIRASLQAAVVKAESAFLDVMAEFYATAAPMVGYRLRPEFGGDYRILAALGASVVEGLGLRTIVSPEIVNLRFKQTAFTTETDEHDWSMASLGFTAILTSMVEPDPRYISPPVA